MAAAPSNTSVSGMAPPSKGGQVSQVQQQFAPMDSPPGGGLPPPPPQNVGGNMSLTPGQIIFTEFQARVFNQTEAMYKTSGFLGISLFEDSYLLSKATANYIISGGAPLSGTVSSINPIALAVYRAVLGIQAPAPPPPPPPDPNVGTQTGPVGGDGNSTVSGGATTPTNGSAGPATVDTSVPTVDNSPSSITQVVDNGPAVSTPSAGGSSGPKPNNLGISGIGGIGGYGGPMGGAQGGGSKIICNELYRQGFLSEEMWDADERYGEMMFEKDPKLVIGYQMWARSVVKFMKKNPKNTKMAYWLFKPWTEYMGYKMGVVKKPTLRGRFTNWIGSQFSYAVFNLFNGKRLLDKYNYKLFKAENNIPTYKMA